MLGAFQSRTPMRSNDNRGASFIFVRSTSQSHSAPRIIWAHKQSSKYRFGKTSFHQRWCEAVASSPAWRTPWKVSWVIYNFSSVFPSNGNEERGYLKRCGIMSPSRRRGILFVAESSNLPRSQPVVIEIVGLDRSPKVAALMIGCWSKDIWTSGSSEMG